MKHTYETGLLGEKEAEDWLCGTQGMITLERRFRSRRGEIDLIMRDGDTIVFVEVKTRKTGDAGNGMISVNTAKQKRIAESAIMYLMNRRLLDQPVRFDVVEVRPGSVMHIRNAFQPGGMFF